MGLAQTAPIISGPAGKWAGSVYPLSARMEKPKWWGRVLAAILIGLILSSHHWSAHKRFCTNFAPKERDFEKRRRPPNIFRERDDSFSRFIAKRDEREFSICCCVEIGTKFSKSAYSRFLQHESCIYIEQSDLKKCFFEHARSFFLAL